MNFSGVQRLRVPHFFEKVSRVRSSIQHERIVLQTSLRLVNIFSNDVAPLYDPFIYNMCNCSPHVRHPEHSAVS